MAKYEKWLTEEGLLLLEGWARDGLTDEQIAHNMGITRKTLAEWKKKYSDICDTLKRAKEVVDIQVENALYKRAVGFKYKEVVRERIPDTNELVVTREIEKTALPDTTAQIFWLKNRVPNKWRDKAENVNINKQDKEININIVSTKSLKNS